jgi:hypothetical protein
MHPSAVESETASLRIHPSVPASKTG